MAATRRLKREQPDKVFSVQRGYEVR
jgi:hypothetical protein